MEIKTIEELKVASVECFGHNPTLGVVLGNDRGVYRKIHDEVKNLEEQGYTLFIRKTVV